MYDSSFKKEFVDRASVGRWTIFFFIVLFILIGSWAGWALYEGYEYYFAHNNSYELAKIIIATIYVFVLLAVTPYGLSTTLVDFVIIGIKFKKIASLPFKLYKNSTFDSLSKKPYVGVVCPTCDDFMPEGFIKNLEQNYKNVIFYILDDSKTDEYIKMIDKFVKGKPNVKLIRRTEHKYAKTGNINNFLKTYKTPCEYYVFLDADTIMRPDFIELNIKLFYSSIPNLALVTSQISAHRSSSVFENIIHYRVGNTTPYFLLQNHTGMACYLGWAGIVKKSVLEEVNFFPEEGVLNDDQGLQLRFVEKNFHGFFSNLSPVTSQEPLTMYEFNKRESRWYNANADLLVHEKISKDVLKSKESPFTLKKAYFKNSFLFTMILPIFGILSLILNSSLYIMHFQPTGWYSITHSWLYIFAFYLLFKFLIWVFTFSHSSMRFRDGIVYLLLAGRINTASMWKFRKMIFAYVKTIFNIKQRKFNRTAKSITSNEKLTKFLIKHIIYLIIEIAAITCSFIFLPMVLSYSLPISAILVIWSLPTFWEVVFSIISYFHTNKPYNQFDVIYKFNNIREEYAFKQI
jgi:hypothetical protein